MLNMRRRSPSPIEELENHVTNENTPLVVESPREKSDQLSKARLPEDAFSLLYMSQKNFSYKVVISVFLVFAVQFLILCVVARDILNYEDDKYWPNPPADVSVELRISQYFAIFYAVFMEENITTSLSVLLHLHMFFGKAETPQEDKFQRVTIILGLLGKFVIGLSSLFISLIIVLQSNKAMELFANFAGMYFISSVDGIYFMLAKNGIFGGAMEARAKQVRKIHVTNQQGYSTVVLLAILSMMLGSCAWINYLQYSGELLPHSITMYLGDEIMFWPSLFNGEYEWNGMRISGRPLYVESRCLSRPTDQRVCGIVSYCLVHKTWAWSTVHLNADDGRHDINSFREASCKNFEVVSPRTEAFDLMEVPASEWSMLSQPSGVEINPPKFEIMLNDCKSRDDCSDAGVCDAATRTCECDYNRYGVRCETRKPSQRIETDPRSDGLTGFADTYDLLLEDEGEIVMTPSGRPIYYHYFKEAGFFNLIVYGGYRWFVVKSTDLPIFTGNDTSYLVSYAKEFHANEGLDAGFVSQPSRGYSPAGLEWNVWLSKTSKNSERENGSLGTVVDANVLLIDSYCYDDGHCGNGKCVASVDDDDSRKICSCEVGFFGAHCQMNLVEGKMSIVLVDGDATNSCASCNDVDFWFFDAASGFQRPDAHLYNGGFCAPFPSLTAVSLTELGISRRLAFFLNATHFSVFASNDDRRFQRQNDEDTRTYYLDHPGICERGELVNVVERPPEGSIVRYEDTFEVKSTSVSCGLKSVECNGSFSLGVNECVLEDFSYSKRRRVDRFFVRINLKIAGQLRDRGS